MSNHGINVHARLLLSEDAGIWFNVDNYPQVIARYQVFREWARAENLHLQRCRAGHGIAALSHPRITTPTPWTLFHLLSRAHSNTLFPAASRAYIDLAAQIRADGYAVHSYQYPLIVDDRRSGSTLFQRALHVVDLPADVEVLLCYSSAVPRAIFGSDLGGALIAEYGAYADSVGVGSTGGGLRPGGAARPNSNTRLTWKAFERDLRLAAAYTDTIHIFSLEGTYAAGYSGTFALIRLGRRNHGPLAASCHDVLGALRHQYRPLVVALWLGLPGLVGLGRRRNHRVSSCA